MMALQWSSVPLAIFMLPFISFSGHDNAKITLFNFPPNMVGACFNYSRYYWDTCVTFTWDKQATRLTSQFHQSPVLGKSLVPLKFLCPVQSCSHTAVTSLRFPHTFCTCSIVPSTASVPPCSPNTAPLPTQSGKGFSRPAKAV